MLRRKPLRSSRHRFARGDAAVAITFGSLFAVIVGAFALATITISNLSRVPDTAFSSSALYAADTGVERGTSAYGWAGNAAGLAYALDQNYRFQPMPSSSCPSTNPYCLNAYRSLQEKWLYADTPPATNPSSWDKYYALVPKCSGTTGCVVSGGVVTNVEGVELREYQGAPKTDLDKVNAGLRSPESLIATFNKAFYEYPELLWDAANPEEIYADRTTNAPPVNTISVPSDYQTAINLDTQYKFRPYAPCTEQGNPTNSPPILPYCQNYYQVGEKAWFWSPQYSNYYVIHDDGYIRGWAGSGSATRAEPPINATPLSSEFLNSPALPALLYTAAELGSLPRTGTTLTVPSDYQTAITLDTTYGFRVDDACPEPNYCADRPDLHTFVAKWIWAGTQSQNQWFALFSDGKLRRWESADNDTTFPSKPAVATLDPSYYATPALLYTAQELAGRYNAEERAGFTTAESLDLQHEFYPDPDAPAPGYKYPEWGYGRWIRAKDNGVVNGAPDKWYVIFPNGDLRKYTDDVNQLQNANNLVEELRPEYFLFPSLLWNASEWFDPMCSAETGAAVSSDSGASTYNLKVSGERLVGGTVVSCPKNKEITDLKIHSLCIEARGLAQRGTQRRLTSEVTLGTAPACNFP